MILITESYNALGELQPEAELTIANIFDARLGPEQGMPQPIVLGIWVKTGATQVEPRYLTQAQLDKLFGSSV